MSNEQKKTRLAQASQLRVELDGLEERLTRLRIESGSEERRRADEKRLKAKIRALQSRIHAIEDAISSVVDPLERSVLRLRYLDGDTARLTKWDAVAVRIYGDDDEKDIRAVHRIHASALNHIKLEDKNER